MAADIRPIDQAHLVDARSAETGAIKAGQTHHPRRPLFGIVLNERGKKVRNAVLATSIALGGGAVGASILQASQPQPGHIEIMQTPPVALVTSTEKPTAKPEINLSSITVAEVNLEKPPTKIMNATVMIKIDNDNEMPTPRTAPDEKDKSNMYGAGWTSISELNGQPIGEAVNSNGQLEIVMKDPLVTFGTNPENGQDGTGMWITALNQDGNPVYISAGTQETVNFVMIAPDGGNKTFLENVSPKDKAISYGTVEIKPPPSMASEQ